MRPLIDALLTTDPALRSRLTQVVVALLAMCAGVLGMLYMVWVGAAAPRAAAWWTAITVSAMALVYAAIRSGWTRRFEDPSIAVAQMLCAITCCAAAYALVGPGRGGVFPILMVALMFGMFGVTQRQMRGVTLYAVALFGATMAVMAHLDPQRYPPRVELGHFFVVATMLPVSSFLAERLNALRRRARRQRDDLAQALARIRELITRDELTGLANRRHMRELLEQEHQRCIRSGRTFCIALLDVDHFKSVNEAHGRTVGDAVLRSVALEAMRRVRVTDVVARWGGDRFLLMLADAHATLARAGVERVREGASAVPLKVPGGELALSVSAGLVEHHAGETVDMTVLRAERALAEAKAQGRGRLVVG